MTSLPLRYAHRHFHSANWLFVVVEGSSRTLYIIDQEDHTDVKVSVTVYRLDGVV